MFSTEIADDIATVTIHAKTMPPDFFRHSQVVFEELADNPDLRAVVIRSDQKCFTYGLDLPAAFGEMGEFFQGGTAEPRSRLRKLILDLQKGFNAIADLPVPTIAAVHGWCIGGGLDLISACDIRLASADTKISLRETKVAIVADLGSLQRLPGIIGKGHTREMAFTGKDIDAKRAAEIGLVNAVYEDRDAVWAAADEMAREIAANAPLVVRGVKTVLDACENMSVRDGLEYVATWNSAFVASEDLAEAAAAFMEKRQPVFRGK